MTEASLKIFVRVRCDAKLEALGYSPVLVTQWLCRFVAGAATWRISRCREKLTRQSYYTHAKCSYGNRK